MKASNRVAARVKPDLRGGVSVADTDANAISITPPHNEWLQQQIDNGLFPGPGELLNFLIGLAGKYSDVYASVACEESMQYTEEHGYVEKTMEEMLEGFKERARREGRL